MHVISRKKLKDYWQEKPEAEGELKAWYAEACNADWKSPAELKVKYGTASILKAGRVVFNICGNKYRLVVRINYQFAMVYIRFIGTHKEYDKINAEKI
jgi:mRNA interferase HigB